MNSQKPIQKYFKKITNIGVSTAYIIDKLSFLGDNNASY
jgi:hypothetical protein